MGISTDHLKLLCRALKDQKREGACVTLGVQGIQGNEQVVSDTIRACGIEPAPNVDVFCDESTQFGRTIHQKTLFRWLGYDKADAIDLFKSEGATLIADLNKPVPESWHGKYSLVYDGGTLEHCFNLSMVMQNITNLLKVGGVVIHGTPISGMLNHGMYQPSPTLFYDYYRTNGFDRIDSHIVLTSPYLRRVRVIPLWPESPIPRSYGRADATIFFATIKMKKHEKIACPVQSYYESGIPAPRNGWLGKLSAGLPRLSAGAYNLLRDVKSC
jgi:hypothetical protein